jgi:DGQHR domain-containing protein
VAKASKKKKTKPKLSAEQKKALKLKRDHIRSARAVFRNCGFDRVPELSEKEISFGGQAGEFDDAYLHENVVLLIEYTTSQSSDVTSHLKNKKILFRKIVDDPLGFLTYLRGKFEKFNERLSDTYHEDRYIVRIVYCSRNDFDGAVKVTVDEPVYMDYPVLKYFEKISSVIRLSAQSEFFAFVQVDPGDVGEQGKFSKKGAAEPYDGLALPEEASGFPKGYKVVSFYCDASALMERAFVLRRSGWRGSFEAYQRMLLPSKVEAIRTSLKRKGQVAVNNIVVTLPSDVHPVKEDGTTINVAELKKTEAVKISLPARANSIGLIDGQHRLFSYHRSRVDDPTIAKLRHQQHLLVTGIVYPKALKGVERERFEAALFLSINSNQTSAQAELRQEIEVLLNPFSVTAMAKQVMQRLASSGPLAGHVETYFFDKGKLKTSSIVSFALIPLLKTSGPDTLFKLFKHPEKEGILDGSSDDALQDYLKFATTRISIFMSAVKANIDDVRWTPDRAVPNRLLTVTYVNAFLITLRKIIGAGGPATFDALKAKLVGIDKFPFKTFHSSQYNRMAEKIYDKHFI